MINLREFSSLFRAGGIYIAFDVINKMVPFVLLPLLTNYIHPEEFGVLNNFVTITTIVNVFLAFGASGIVTVKYYDNSSAYVSNLITSVLYILILSVVFIIIIVLMFSVYIVKYTHVPTNFIFFAVFASLGQFLSLINMTLWRLETKPIHFGIYQVAQTIVEFSLTVLFVAFFLMDWEGRVYGMTIAYGLFGLYSLVFLYRRGFVTKSWDIKIVKECMLFGLPMIPHGLANWMKIGLDRLYLTNLVGLSDSGIYSVAVQFGTILTVILIAFNNAFSPYLFRSLSKINDVIRKKLVFLSYTYATIILLLALVLYVSSKFFILNYLDPKYHKAVVLLPWILISNVLLGFYFITVNYVFYGRRNVVIAIITFSTTLLHAVISYLLIKRIGVLGSVISLTITNFLTFILIWMQSNKCVKLPWFGIIKN